VTTDPRHQHTQPRRGAEGLLATRTALATITTTSLEAQFHRRADLVCGPDPEARLNAVENRSVTT